MGLPVAQYAYLTELRSQMFQSIWAFASTVVCPTKKTKLATYNSPSCLSLYTSSHLYITHLYLSLTLDWSLAFIVHWQRWTVFQSSPMNSVFQIVPAYSNSATLAWLLQYYISVCAATVWNAWALRLHMDLPKYETVDSKSLWLAVIRTII